MPRANVLVGIAVLLPCFLLSGRTAEAQRGKSAPGSCQKLAQRYRAIADAHLGEPPLTALVNAKGAGVTLIEPLARFTDLPADLRQWGRTQTPAIQVPDELTPYWPASGTTLHKVPGTNVYWLDTQEGTAHCHRSVLFTVDENGVATKTEQQIPFGGDDADDGSGACGTVRRLGQLDETPAFFEEDYDWSPRLSSTITVSTWEESKSSDECKITFEFEPHFSDKTLNDWNRMEKGKAACTGASCDGLHRAAFKLVAAVQDGPRSAQVDALAALTPAQRTDYATALGTRPGEEDIIEPLLFAESLLDDSPLSLPYVQDGSVYVARLGHFTIGWRTFADWSVEFRRVENGTLQEPIAFAVGMTKGKLTEVEPAPW